MLLQLISHTGDAEMEPDQVLKAKSIYDVCFYCPLASDSKNIAVSEGPSCPGGPGSIRSSLSAVCSGGPRFTEHHRQ